jgi:hypothetical protein
MAKWSKEQHAKFKRTLARKKRQFKETPRMKLPEETLRLYWRPHDDHRARLWRSDWTRDQFEIVPWVYLLQVSEFCAKFGFPFDEADDE